MQVKNFKLNHLDYIYLLFICVLLMDRVCLISIGGFSIFPYQALIVILSFLLWTNYKKIYIPKSITILYYLIIMQGTIISLIGNVDIFTIVKESIQTLLLIILSWVLYNYLIKNFYKFIKFIEYALIFWVISGALFFIAYYIIGSRFGVYYSDFLPYPRATGFNVDPNVYGIYILTFMPLALYHNRYNIKRKILINVVCLIAILLTFSRANTVVIISFFILYILLSIIFKVNTKKEITILICVMLFIFIGLFIVPTTRDAITIRIEQLFMEASVTSDSRFGIWVDTLDILKDNFLIGVGIDHPIMYLGKYVHNTFIEIILSFGIIGLILIWKYVYNLIIHISKIKNDEFNFYISLAYINHILSLLFVSLINFEPTFVLFTITCVYCDFYYKQKILA